MKCLKPVLSMLCAGALMCPSASAYYYFLRYFTRTAPFNGIPQKWDLNSLPNKTLNFYVSDQSATALATNDTAVGMLSQIRLAAKQWNDIETSDLRLAFGGVSPTGTAASGPGIDVIFNDDIPPGVNAYTTFQTQDVTSIAAPSFVPMNRSTVSLKKNLSDRPSYGEAFFQTVVHEFGHALGLQHSMAAGAMSTEVTRSTTRSKPLGSDDIAGISLLYPARGFNASVGSITGRVAIGATGVPMASVVVIPSTGTAISTITNPDGSYRVDGIAPGQYFVYAHPLPPALDGEASPAGIIAPIGADGRSTGFGPSFGTVFFPGTRDPQVAVTVFAGTSVDNVNFGVQSRTAPAIHSMQSYSFVGQVTVKPATLNHTVPRGLMVVSATGLLNSSGGIPADLSVTPLGGSAGQLAQSPRLYQPAPAFVQLDLAFSAFSTDGAHHIIYSSNGDVYVQPSAYVGVSKAPPTITTVANAQDATGGRVVAITGTNLDQNTRFYFDGNAAAIRSFDDQTGRVLVTPPPAPSGHKANVTAVASDGQSSLFSQGNAGVPTYTYDLSDATSITVTPNSLPAGSESMVEVVATGIGMIDGMAKLGFGNSDIAVRRVWVTAPNRLIAEIGVNPNAASGNLAVTVANGLQVFTQTAAFSVQPANPRLLNVQLPIVNPATGLSVFTAGAQASVPVANLPANATPAAITVTVNDQLATVTGVTGTQVTFLIPPATTSGPAVVRLRTATDTAQPVLLHVEFPPPAISAIQTSGIAVDATRPVNKGDTVTIVVNGLIADAFTGLVTTDALALSIGGVDHSISQITASSSIRGSFEIQFIVKDSVQSGTQTLTLTQENRSTAVNLPIR